MIQVRVELCTALSECALSAKTAHTGTRSIGQTENTGGGGVYPPYLTYLVEG